MFIPPKIPKIVYTALSPLIPLQEKVTKLESLLKRRLHIQKVFEHKQQPRQVPLQKANDEYIKNHLRKEKETKDIMDQLIKKSNRRILSLDSFSLFPAFFKNTIEIEESRIFFIYKQPFTFQSHSVDISDISNVFIDSALFFASMQIVSRTFTENTITIGYLNKNEANKARMIIEGLRTLARSKIDTSVYTKDELVQTLESLQKR